MRSADIKFEIGYNQNMESFFKRSKDLFIVFLVIMLLFVLGNLFIYS